MSFSSPAFLLALLLVPLGSAAHLARRKRTQRNAVRFTAVPALKLAGAGIPSWRRHLPPALALAAVAALAIALAKPQRTVAVPVERASIMLVTDHSRSMLATDVEPNRLTAAKRAARTFLSKVPPRVRVGAVAFSDAADAVSTPSRDRGEASQIIDEQIADGATATGEALQVAIDTLRRDRQNGERAPTAIVLLSDGRTTTGRDPVEVADAARKLRMPIFTVSLGTDAATVPNPGFGPPLPAQPDPETLDRIAEASDGRAFTAENSEELSSIYETLGSRLGSRREGREITAVFAIGGGLLLLGAAAASVRFTGRLP
jgi:Ca-activated chloride channel family protein